MKKFLFFILVTSFSLQGFSQNFRENRKKADQIKANAEYYCGESGNCKNTNKADKEALRELIKNITDDKSLQPVPLPESDDNKLQNQILDIFTNALEQTSYNLLLSNDEGSVKMFRYISKKDFASLCKTRENRIMDFVEQGNKAEDLFRVNDALRYYYWATLLCYAHPNGNSLIYIDEADNIEQQVYKWLLRRIEMVLDETVLIPVRQDKRTDDDEFLLKVCINGNSVNGLDFSYNNGNGVVRGSVENGIGHVRIVHNDMRDVVVDIDVECKKAAKIHDPEVYSIMNALDEPLYFRGAKKTVEVDKAKKVNKISEMKSYSDTEMAGIIKKAGEFQDSCAISNENYYEKTMLKVEKALSKNNLNELEQYCTSVGFGMMDTLLKYGKCKVVGKPSYRFLEFGDEVLCRSIPMQFDFSNGTSFIREVVFRFDKKSQKINAVAFKLSDITEYDIMSKDKWSMEARQMLVNFLEDYQTAYALKRKKYLNQIYSDDALIIVGSVLKETAKSDNVRLKDKTKIKYLTMTKSEYMERLNGVFNTNEYVSIHFTNTSFNTVSGKKNVIGVQLKQEYFSTTYGDVGYLFLIVDLRGDMPVIHVRTWQPNETSVDELINSTSFEFN